MNPISSAHSLHLANSIKSHIDLCGESYVEAVSDKTTLLRSWLQHLDAYEKNGCADVLLDGVSSAIFEVAACLTAGFARVAIGSIRAQIDLVLSWLFFKDHPVEWARLEAHGDGFMQKSELIRYLGEKLCGEFGVRWGVLRQSKLRTIEDPYALLSAHLHKQSSGVVVSIESCSKVVCKKSICDEIIIIQSSVSEYLNDVLLACYSDKWAALPIDIVDSARSRLTKPQETVLFS